MPPLSDRFADLSDLRRFGVALARDDRFVNDQESAAALVDRLFRQASLEAVGAGVRDDADQTPRDDARVRAFEDGESAWDENAESIHRNPRTGEIGMGAAVRSLPLELREPLLIVVLAGFTHQEAALALDISLATLITRLTKARERVAALTREPLQAPAKAAPHLRVVK